MKREHIVIAGGGLAGLRAAERLRDIGYRGTITTIGEERRGPYNRPPLSKQILEHKLHPEDLGFATYGDLEIQERRGVRAERLDPVAHKVVLDTGEEIAYDGLVVATGVSARTLPAAPNLDERVVSLRTLDDALALDGLMRRARRLVIVGGGFIGCEVASTARRRGIDVTLVDLAPYLLGRIVGPALGAMVTQIHVDAGVDLRLGRSITAWRTGVGGVTIALDDGSEVTADAVLVAIGTVPRTDWLADLPLDLSDGVLCDETSHVVGLDDVVAAGDVARWPNRRFGGPARRVEHWINAVEHGQAAAENLLHGRAGSRPFTPMPRFWSEQHGVRIQAVGVPAIADRIALAEGSLAERRLVAACLDGERLVGALGVDSPRAMLRFADMVETATAANLAGTLADDRAPRALLPAPAHRPATWPGEPAVHRPGGERRPAPLVALVRSAADRP